MSAIFVKKAVCGWLADRWPPAFSGKFRSFHGNLKEVFIVFWGLLCYNALKAGRGM